MLACLITHAGDRELARNLARHIASLGGVQTHECLIVTPSTNDLSGIEDVLRPHFQNIFVHRYTETMKGWPYGANEACAQAMMHIWANPELRYHYLMLEPDCVPTTRDWLTRIDNEYRRCGMPVLGVRIDTRQIGTNVVVGRHTVGVAVYPKNFPQICPLVRSLIDSTMGYFQQKAMPMPWDAMFGPYTCGKNLTADTTQIQHLSRVMQQTPQGIRWDCPTLDNAMQQARRDAVLIHGCKLPEFLPAIAGVPAVVAHPITPPPIVTSGFRRVIDNTFADLPAIPKPQKVAPDPRELAKKEFGIEFEITTPHFRRALDFYGGRMTWPKMKSHAAHLGVPIYGVKKPQLITAIVLKEAEDLKEPWTKDIPRPEPPPAPEVPVEDAPPVAVGLLPLSSSTSRAIVATGLNVTGGVVDEKGNIILPPQDGSRLGEERARKMQQLLQSRSGIIERARSGENVQQIA